MRLEVRKLELNSRLNELFRAKVQLEEQLKEVESQLQYHRGCIAGVEEGQKVIKETQQAEAMEAEAMKPGEVDFERLVGGTAT